MLTRCPLGQMPAEIGKLPAPSHFTPAAGGPAKASVESLIGVRQNEQYPSEDLCGLVRRGG